jgi:hypothetical protein
MVVEGEQVQAAVTIDQPASNAVRIDATKADGAPVLTGSASVGPDHPETALAPRLWRSLENPPAALHIVDQIKVGQRGTELEELTVTFDQSYGALYPFSLEEKLANITEFCSYFDPAQAASNPWGRAIIPIEMLSVLTGSASRRTGFLTRQPSLGLFIDLEVRLLGTPVFVGQTYLVEHEVLAVGQSRRTESYWTSSTLIEADTGRSAAKVLLHHGVFKDSFPDYPQLSVG